jgi:hypothetical protein
VLPIATIPVTSRAPARPRARSIGAVLLVAAAVLVPELAAAPFAGGCDSVPAVGTPAAAALTLLIVVAGLALVLGVQQASAVAPALAVGAAAPLLGGAVGVWLWLTQQPCVGSVLDHPAALLVLQGGAALAVLGASSWLLYVRHEFAPWGGVRGVVTSAAAAMTTFVVGVGFAFLIARPEGYGALVVSLTIALPWAVVVGVTGWLRRLPAIAMAASIGVQAVGLLVMFT